MLARMEANLIYRQEKYSQARDEVGPSLTASRPGGCHSECTWIFVRASLVPAEVPRVEYTMYL